MKKYFLYLFLISFNFSCISLATGHDAYAHFEFCNSLKKRNVVLRPIGESDRSIEGFEDFSEKNLVPQEKLFFKEELKGYQEIISGEHLPPLLVIGVYVDNIQVGLIKLVRTLRPDPSFIFKTEKMI